MAKRVNTQFVVILSACVVAAAGGAVLMLGLPHFWHPARDPKAVIVQGDQKLKGGDQAGALTDFMAAAGLESKSHTAGADDLWVRCADLSLKISTEATNIEDAIKYYGIYRASLQQAQLTNPRNGKVMERMVDEQYQVSHFLQRTDAWKSTADLAGKMISNVTAPGPLPYVYRAEANLRVMIQTSATQREDETIKSINADLDAAIKLDPDSDRAVAVRAQLWHYLARRAEASADPKEGASQRANAEKLLRDYLAGHPNNPIVTLSLVEAIIDAAPEKGAATQTTAERTAIGEKHYDAAITVVRPAFEAHSDDMELGDQLARLYAIRSPKDTARPEAVYKTLIEKHPDSPEGHFKLALFYRDNRMLENSVAQFKECIKLIKNVGGPLAYRIQGWQATSFEEIANLSMDITEKAGVDTPDGKAAMADEGDFVGRLRGAHGEEWLLNLLDGRAELVQHHIPQAIEKLKRADADLKPAPELADPRRKVYVYLGQANLMMAQPQYGLALEYFEKALDLQPNNVSLIIERANLLIQVGRSPDSAASLTELLRYKDRMTPDMVEKAQYVLSLATLNQKGTPQLDPKSINNPEAMVSFINMYLSTGDKDTAMDLLERVLALDEDKAAPSIRAATRLKVLVLYRDGNKTEASDLVDKFLAKHPNDDEFKYLKAVINRPAGADPEQVEQDLIASISDPFTRAMQEAVLWQTRKQPQKELVALQKAEEVLGDATTVDAQQKRSAVIDRIFVTSVMTALDPATAEADKPALWATADKYVTKAEILDLDGVKGNLYKGRLEFLKSGYTKGLNLIEQAAAALPDDGPAHASLGQAYLSVKPPRYADALKEYKIAQTAMPNDMAILRTTISLLLQTGKMSDLEDAQILVNQGRTLSPRDAGLAALQDRISDRAGDLHNAIQVREQIFALNPRDIDNRKHLALLYDRKGGAERDKDLARAVELIKPLSEVDNPDLGNVVFLATLYYEQKKMLDAQRKPEDGQKKMEEAQKLFESFVGDTDPRVKFRALITRGEFYQTIGETKMAESDFKQAIGLQKEGDDEAQRHLADFYFYINDMVRAEETYRAIYAKAKDGEGKTVVLLRLVETLIREGADPRAADKLKDAETLLQSELLAAHPDDIRGLSLRAFLRNQQLRPQDALNDISVVLAKDKDFPDAIYYKAMAQAMLNKDLDTAATELRNVCERNPNVAKYHLLLATISRELRQYVAAANEYSMVIQLRPDLLEVRRDYAGYLMSLVLVEQRVREGTDDFAVSIRGLAPTERLENLLAQSVQDAPQLLWYVMRADVFLVSNKIAEGKALYQDIYDHNPGTRIDPIEVLGYMRALTLNAQRTGSAADYETAVKVATDMMSLIMQFPENQRPMVSGEIFLRRAVAYAGLKKNDEAKGDLGVYFDAAFNDYQGPKESQKPKDLGAFFTAVTTATAVLPADMIVTDLRALLEKHPDDPAVGIGLLRVLVGMKDTDGAGKLIATLNISPNDKAARIFYLRESAMARFQMKDTDGARKDFQELLQVNPKDIQGLNNFAYILGEGMHNPKEALSYAQRAADAIDASGDPLFNPAAGNVYDTLGWTKSLNGDVKGAVVDLQRSLQVQPTTGTYLHLAQTYLKARDSDAAREAITRGRKLAKETGDGSEAEFDQIETQVGSR